KMRKFIKNMLTKTKKIQKSIMAKNKRYYYDYWGKPVYYTREEAFENGFLIDISLVANKLRFRIPVAVTFDLYIHTLNYTEKSVSDALDAIRCLDIQCDLNSNVELEYDLEFETVIGTEPAKEQGYNYEAEELGFYDSLAEIFVYEMLKTKVVYHRGDDNEPVLTLRYPDEPWDKRG
ncbi:MAG TPA: hypothetical protein VD770_05200, partial [Coxiellaceae bacterium]|nr:hypothetical protein [Coxiellaceae bacterium]